MKYNTVKNMNILVFNCGSSSLKYKLITMPEEKFLVGGEAQRIGPQTKEPSRVIHNEGGPEEIFFAEMKNHNEAFQEVLKILNRNPSLKPHAFGHRVVHGGNVFNSHTLIDETVIKKLESIKELATIHNPPATSLIQACQNISPQIPQIAVFDTAFHSTIPDYAYTYPIPKEISLKLDIRKYGFHGTSHAFVAQEAAKILKKPLEKLNAVSCHLGSGGASLCSIVNGKSIDNTMGFSPLQGLIMSTRCGDIDPTITLKLLSDISNIDEVEKLLNNKSGILGMSEFSADIRDIFNNSNKNNSNKNLELTEQSYLWRLKKYLGSYLAITEKTDAIIFTDTIGESVPYVRKTVCSDMDFFGVKIDYDKNENAINGIFDISDKNSQVKILVIPTNEELAIARITYNIIHKRKEK